MLVSCMPCLICATTSGSTTAGPRSLGGTMHPYGITLWWLTMVNIVLFHHLFFCSLISRTKRGYNYLLANRPAPKTTGVSVLDSVPQGESTTSPARLHYQLHLLRVPRGSDAGLTEVWDLFQSLNNVFRATGPNDCTRDQFLISGCCSQ